MATKTVGKYIIVKSKGKQTITHPDKLGKVTIYGNGHIRETFYSVPDWSDGEEEEEEAFTYKGETYYLSEFERISEYAPEWMRQFDGQHGDSFFSGILVKYDGDDDGVKVYTYIS